MTFEDDLAYSHDKADSDFLNKAYFCRWPTTEFIEDLADDMESQRQGIDKRLNLADGSIVNIEEKKRKTDWQDYFIETESVHEKGIKGWIYTTQADYLAYYVVPKKDVHLLPVVYLKKAWKHRGGEWTKRYGERTAVNVGYTTIGVPVPYDVLDNAIGEARQLQRLDKWAVD